MKPVAWLRESAITDIHEGAWTPVIQMESQRDGVDLSETYCRTYVPVFRLSDMCSAKNEELVTITLSRIFETWHKAGIINAEHLRQANIETMASSILFALSHPDEQLDEPGPFNTGADR